MGLAKLRTRSYATSVIGTPEFMAPEMYDEKYDESVDVYAFGMCLLELLTFEYPYEEYPGPAQIFRAVTQGIRPKSFEKLNHPGFRDIIDWCIKPNKEERPTMKQLMEHQFFEDYGFSLEFLNKKTLVENAKEVVAIFRLKITDRRKSRITRKTSIGGKDSVGKGDTVEIKFNIVDDKICNINKNMPHLGKLENEEDRNNIAQVIGHHISTILEARKSAHPNIDEADSNQRRKSATMPENSREHLDQEPKNVAVTDKPNLLKEQPSRFTVIPGTSPGYYSLPQPNTPPPSPADSFILNSSKQMDSDTKPNSDNTVPTNHSSDRFTITETPKLEHTPGTTNSKNDVSILPEGGTQIGHPSEISNPPSEPKDSIPIPGVAAQVSRSTTPTTPKRKMSSDLTMASLDDKLANIFSPESSPPKTSPMSRRASTDPPEIIVNHEAVERLSVARNLIEQDSVSNSSPVNDNARMSPALSPVNEGAFTYTSPPGRENISCLSPVNENASNVPQVSERSITADKSTQILNAIQQLDDEHKQAIIEHNRQLAEMKKQYQDKRQQLKTLLFDELRIQEVACSQNHPGCQVHPAPSTQPAGQEVTRTSNVSPNIPVPMPEMQRVPIAGVSHGNIPFLPHAPSVDYTFQPISVVQQPAHNVPMHQSVPHSQHLTGEEGLFVMESQPTGSGVYQSDIY